MTVERVQITCPKCSRAYALQLDMARLEHAGRAVCGRCGERFHVAERLAAQRSVARRAGTAPPGGRQADAAPSGTPIGVIGAAAFPGLGPETASARRLTAARESQPASPTPAIPRAEADRVRVAPRGAPAAVKEPARGPWRPLAHTWRPAPAKTGAAPEQETEASRGGAPLDGPPEASAASAMAAPEPHEVRAPPADPGTESNAGKDGLPTRAVEARDPTPTSEATSTAADDGPRGGEAKPSSQARGESLGAEASREGPGIVPPAPAVAEPSWGELAPTGIGELAPSETPELSALARLLGPAPK